MNSGAVVLYVTCRDSEEARRIAADLVAARLIACANILPQHIAVYRWEGSVVESAETAMLLKTRAELVVHVSERIRSMHSYDMPGISAWPITGGNADFLNWILSETEVE